MDNCAFSTLQVFVNYGNIMSQMLANTSQCHLRHFETKQTFEKLNDQHQVNKAFVPFLFLFAVVTLQANC